MNLENFLEILKTVNPAVSIGSLALTLAGIFTTYRFILPRKQITYEENFSTPILRGNHPELTVLFRSLPITDPHLQKISIQNTGNREILLSDYVEPLTISFGAQTTVLSADFLSSRPENLCLGKQLQVTADGHSISIENMLLNIGDKFEVKVLTDQECTMAIRARIAGVKSISKRNYLVPAAVGASLAIAGFLVYQWSTYFFYGHYIEPVSSPNRLLYQWSGLLLTAIGEAILLWKLRPALNQFAGYRARKKRSLEM